VVSLWLYENVNTRIEGIITGFDEYMNLVLDDAYEVPYGSVSNPSILRYLVVNVFSTKV